MTSATFGPVCAPAPPAATPRTATNAPMPIRRIMLTRIANSLTNLLAPRHAPNCRATAETPSLAHNTSPLGCYSIAIFQVNHGIAAPIAGLGAREGPPALPGELRVRGSRKNPYDIGGRRTQCYRRHTAGPP